MSFAGRRRGAVHGDGRHVRPAGDGADGSADYDTWADVAAAMDKQLQQGQKEYKDGNTAGSTSDFMAAYNEIYVASNFTQS